MSSKANACIYYAHSFLYLSLSFSFLLSFSPFLVRAYVLVLSTYGQTSQSESRCQRPIWKETMFSMRTSYISMYTYMYISIHGYIHTYVHISVCVLYAKHSRVGTCTLPHSNQYRLISIDSCNILIIYLMLIPNSGKFRSHGNYDATRASLCFTKGILH